jgi:hypothetical protein
MEIPQHNAPERRDTPEEKRFDLTKYSTEQIMKLNSLYAAEFEIRNAAEDPGCGDSLEQLRDALSRLVDKDPERAKTLLVTFAKDLDSEHRERAAEWAPLLSTLDYDLAMNTMINLRVDRDSKVRDAAVFTSNEFEKSLPPTLAAEFLARKLARERQAREERRSS